MFARASSPFRVRVEVSRPGKGNTCIKSDTNTDTGAATSTKYKYYEALAAAPGEHARHGENRGSREGKTAALIALGTLLKHSGGPAQESTGALR